MGVYYDTDAGIVASSLRISSTIIPMVTDGFEFWVLLFFNITICMLRKYKLIDPEAYHADLPWGLTGVTGSLMAFFVVFYNKHIFERYNVIYDLTKEMSERAMNLVSMLRVQVPENTNIQRKAAKLIIASCFLFYFKVDCTHDVTKTEWTALRRLDVLTQDEAACLEEFCQRVGPESKPHLLVLQWCMELLRIATPEPQTRDDLICGFTDAIYELQKCQCEVAYIMELPMPFQYFHIMNLMLLLNLVFWAYSLGCQDSYWAPMIYCFVQMMFQGIRELSTALSDPFGDDEVDFPVNEWMMSLYMKLYGILEDSFDVQNLSVDGTKPLKDVETAINILNVKKEGTLENVQRRSRGRRLESRNSIDPPGSARGIQRAPSRGTFAPRPSELERELAPRRTEWEKRRVEGFPPSRGNFSPKSEGSEFPDSALNSPDQSPRKGSL